MLMRFFYSAGTWAGIGLVSGVYWREFTKLSGFEGHTQLATAHTHALALGMLVFMGMLALQRLFPLTDRAAGRVVWLYNAGLGLTWGMMVLKGTLQVLGIEFAESPMLSGFHGLGHMIIAGTLLYYFLQLRKSVRAAEAEGNGAYTQAAPATVGA
ncbi:MAG: DUF2871 domain-containing protein [bacterium]|nr:DUF2871 domain-containing protein [bacterium]